MLISNLLAIVALYFSLACIQYGTCQFPSVCNTLENLENKICCPNDCGSSLGRGTCVSVVSEATTQASNADGTLTRILETAATVTQKGTIDTRYLWPTMVFESICRCNSSYYGVDCSECAFGWTGSDCQTRKAIVKRKSFSSLSNSEKQNVITGFQTLKSEMGYWSVIVSEPNNTSGQVILQNVSTYDYLIYVHNYVTRDGSRACRELNGGLIDFAHSGSNFPVWHRTYLLILERAMQRVLSNDSFGLPYWKWEENDISPFASEYFGSIPPDGGGSQNVSGDLLDNWKTVCDFAYRNEWAYRDDTNVDTCAMFWTVCNPKSDLNQNNRLQRGNELTYYLPGVREIEIALAAPDYDTSPNDKGSSGSFRNRMEGWNVICSGQEALVGPQQRGEWRMHNLVHFWVGGHMRSPPATVNDPIFSLHHANIDRILESWMNRFTRQNRNIPEYDLSGGHPGHNRDDFMVPFVPLITPGEQYSPASNWGYSYDALFDDDINDSVMEYSDPSSISQCYICTAGNACFCSGKMLNEKNERGFGPCENCPPNTCSINNASLPTRPPSGSSSRKLETTYLFVWSSLLIWHQVFSL